MSRDNIILTMFIVGAAVAIMIIGVIIDWAAPGGL